jgi:hypothetical protein
VNQSAEMRIGLMHRTMDHRKEQQREETWEKKAVETTEYPKKGKSE